MRILIAITSCHRHRTWQDSQRQTWIKDLPFDVDYRFFLGSPHPLAVSVDEVFLDVPDGYKELHLKTRGILQWALAQGYQYTFKVDVDTLVIPANLLASGFEQYDYTGNAAEFPGNTPYPSGGAGYWLSEKAMRLVVSEPVWDIPFEDVCVSVLVRQHGIPMHDDKRYKYLPTDTLDKDTISYHISSAAGGRYHPTHMYAKYREAQALR